MEIDRRAPAIMTPVSQYGMSADEIHVAWARARLQKVREPEFDGVFGFENESLFHPAYGILSDKLH